MHIGGHEYSYFSPRFDEGLQVGFTDAQPTTNAVGDQITGLDPAAQGLGGDVKVIGRLLNSKQGRERVIGHGDFVVSHENFPYLLFLGQGAGR